MMIKENAIKNIENFEIEYKQPYSFLFIPEMVIEQYRERSPRDRNITLPIIQRVLTASVKASINTRTVVNKKSKMYKRLVDNNLIQHGNDVFQYIYDNRKMLVDETETLNVNMSNYKQHLEKRNWIVDIKFIDNNKPIDLKQISRFTAMCYSWGLNKSKTDFTNKKSMLN